MGYRGKEEKSADITDADNGAQVLGTEEVGETEEAKEPEVSWHSFSLAQGRVFFSFLFRQSILMYFRLPGVG